MSALVLKIPPRPRVPAPAPAEFDYVLSADGRSAVASGRAAPALLPKASRVIAVVDDADVAWHRVALPKAPPARMRAALVGVMEEALLEDDEALHFALAPGAGGGQASWVAVLDKRWLAGLLAALREAGVAVDAVRPASAPAADAGWHGHFAPAEGGDADALTLVLSGADGVVVLPLDGSLSRALAAPALEGAGSRWTAAPAAAEAAARWLGAPVAVLTDAERLLMAAAGPWELLQFDLAPRHRGVRALREGLHRFAGPAWRPARYGLVALALLHVAALNAWAWQQQRAIDDRRAAATTLLRSAHPQVRAVLDAPLQMERETALLRTAAGRAGEGDLETLLGAAAAGWPDGAAPAPSLRFEPGRLTIGTPGWSESQLAQFRDRLRAGGWSVEAAEGRVTLTRSAAR